MARIIGDVGKIIFAAIVVGRFVSPERITFESFVVGFLVSVLCVLGAVLLVKERAT